MSATLARGTIGKLVLLVSLVWFCFTLLLIVQIDNRFGDRLRNFKEHPDEVLSDLLGSFKQLDQSKQRKIILNKIIQSMELGVRRTEDILKMTHEDIMKMYDENVQALAHADDSNIGEDMEAYKKLEELGNRLRELIGHYDVPLKRHGGHFDVSQKRHEGHNDVPRKRGAGNARVVHLDQKVE